jgi:ribulose-5-phosphate 4-epimerase/fuculose-1-phosphate aldolase
VILRGNGAVTVGATVAEAVARMWVLEASAVLNATAAAVGTPVPLPDDEQAAWRAVAAELLPRIWTWISAEETP